MPVREDSGCSISAVHVKPEPVMLADFCQCCQIVDRSGVGGASRGYYAKGSKPRRLVFSNARFKLAQVHLNARVDWDAAQRPASQPQQPGGFVERMMSFV